jgi:hypothetical protein
MSFVSLTKHDDHGTGGQVYDLRNNEHCVTDQYRVDEKQRRRAAPHRESGNAKAGSAALSNKVDDLWHIAGNDQSGRRTAESLGERQSDLYLPHSSVDPNAVQLDASRRDHGSCADVKLRPKDTCTSRWFPREVSVGERALLVHARLVEGVIGATDVGDGDSLAIAIFESRTRPRV